MAETSKFTCSKCGDLTPEDVQYVWKLEAFDHGNVEINKDGRAELLPNFREDEEFVHEAVFYHETSEGEECEGSVTFTFVDPSHQLLKI
jgi:hypothetical protein